MVLRQGIAAASATSAVLGVFLAVGSPPAQAASVDPEFFERRLQSGTYYHYIINAVNANIFDPDLDTEVGYVYMDSNPATIPLKHVIGVCDQDADGLAVYMRVYPTNGGYIDYEDDSSTGDPCVRKTLGYSISHFRMLVKGELSDPLEAPPE